MTESEINIEEDPCVKWQQSILAEAELPTLKKFII